MKCSVCNGTGGHVDPAIDANGITAEQQGDIEFMDQYMSGAYDVVCNNCGGAGEVEADNIAQLNQAAEDRRLAAAENGDYEAFSTAHDHRWPS